MMDGKTRFVIMRLIVVQLLLLSVPIISAQTIVKTLPGFVGDLPFNLETGYVGVGEDESVQLFYYFVESERRPEDDPLIVWLAGGPGCSTLRAFFFEIGPLQFHYGNTIDNVPALELNPYSWTKMANVIYLDAPVNTGFSYAKILEAGLSSDTISSAQTAEFMRKWVRDHPKFKNNEMYVTGISYSGTVIPMVADDIYKGNDEGKEPLLNIRGYMMGNPLTDKKGDVNSRIEYAYRMALLSDELYEAVKESCDGEYIEVETKSPLCLKNLDEANRCVEKINMQQILEPDCDPPTNLTINRHTNNPKRRNNRKSFRENTIRLGRSHSLREVVCRNACYQDATDWANDKKVQKALNVREGTIKEWVRCNMNLQYKFGDTSLREYVFDVSSSVIFHENLSKRNCRALISSGDHDMLVPHVGTHQWIRSMNLSVINAWEPWYVDGQEAGFSVTYGRNNYSLIFATVKGAGHTAAEFKPAECQEMVGRWFSYYPL